MLARFDIQNPSITVNTRYPKMMEMSMADSFILVQSDGVGRRTHTVIINLTWSGSEIHTISFLQNKMLKYEKTGYKMPGILEYWINGLVD